MMKYYTDVLHLPTLSPWMQQSFGKQWHMWRDQALSTVFVRDSHGSQTPAHRGMRQRQPSTYEVRNSTITQSGKKLSRLFLLLFSICNISEEVKNILRLTTVRPLGTWNRKEVAHCIYYNSQTHIECCTIVDYTLNKTVWNNASKLLDGHIAPSFPTKTMWQLPWSIFPAPEPTTAIGPNYLPNPPILFFLLLLFLLHKPQKHINEHVHHERSTFIFLPCSPAKKFSCSKTIAVSLTKCIMIPSALPRVR